MIQKRISSAIAFGVMLAGATAAYADQHEHDQDGFFSLPFTLPLDTTGFSNGKSIKFTVGVSSGAYHRPGDAADTLYTVTDRGVNIKCKDDVKLIGIDLCASGKIFPVPSFSPTIYTFKINANGVNLIDALQIKDQDGHVISGLPNPLISTDTELAFDKNGNEIPLDPNGLDVESMVRLQDGSFWASEEYGPSLVHIAATGEVLERRVPYGIDTDLSGANYPVVGSFPAILAKRKLNRGMESIAVSGDEQFLYTSLQSPLANPNGSAYKQSRNVRLLKTERLTGKPVGEYVYQMDLPTTFAADNSTKQSDVKISEMAWLDNNELLVLERISNTTKLYRVKLIGASNILDSQWDQLTTSPTLEQTTNLAAAGITPLTKELVMDSSRDYPGMLPPKVEGIALFSPERAILVNDNDFGISGAKTVFSQVKLND